MSILKEEEARALLEIYGSPVLVYDEERLLERIKIVRESFSPIRVNYRASFCEVKEILSLFSKQGVETEVNDFYMFKKALWAGFSAASLWMQSSFESVNTLKEALSLGANLVFFSRESINLLEGALKGRWIGFYTTDHLPLLNPDFGKSLSKQGVLIKKLYFSTIPGVEVLRTIKILFPSIEKIHFIDGILAQQSGRGHLAVRDLDKEGINFSFSIGEGEAFFEGNALLVGYARLSGKNGDVYEYHADPFLGDSDAKRISFYGVDGVIKSAGYELGRRVFLEKRGLVTSEKRVYFVDNFWDYRRWNHCAVLMRQEAGKNYKIIRRRQVYKDAVAFDY